MMSRYFFAVLSGVMVLAALGFCQPATVALSYYDDGQGMPEPPLSNACTGGVPYADGTAMVSLIHDEGPQGPDSLDPVYYSVPINGEAEFGEQGYFYTDNPDVVLQPPDPLTNYYVEVRGGGICWRTHTFDVSGGVSELGFTGSDWTCLPDTMPPRPRSAFA